MSLHCFVAFVVSDEKCCFSYLKFYEFVFAFFFVVVIVLAYSTSFLRDAHFPLKITSESSLSSVIKVSS